MRAALMALLVAAPLAAADFIVDPPAPDTASLIHITFLVGCLGADPSVTVANKTINIVVRNMPGIGGCISTYTPYPATYTLGPLPAGTYDVQAFGKTIETLVVREATPFTLSPFVVPTTGGAEVIAQRGGLEFPSDFGSVPPIIKVGNQRVSGEGAGESAVIFTAPPGAAGTAADVSIDSRYADQPNTPNLFVAHSALVYYDPAQPPDRSIAEPVLFPIAFDGPGAFGSQWRTENTVLRRQGEDNTFGFPTFYRPPCDGCSTKLGDDTLKLPAMSRADGLLLWLLRGTEQYASMTSRIRDVSRSSSNAGISVPVVRGKDFKNRFIIHNVPIEPGSRVTIRLWSADSKPVYVTISASVGGEGFSKFAGTYLTLMPFSDPQLQFASADFQAAFGNSGVTLIPPGAKATADFFFGALSQLQYPSPDYVATFWPMISITNNETQQVTIFAPPQ